MRLLSETLCLTVLILFTTACSDEAEPCDRFEGWTIIKEGDRGTTCEYQQIYIYKGEYFTVNSCCVCDFTPMAFDCNNEALCDFGDDCMDRFFRKADYLLSAVEN